MKKKRWSKTARLIFYPVIIGTIVYLVLTQEPGSHAVVHKDYISRIEVENRLIDAREGDRIPFRLRIENRGNKAWRSVGEYPCFLSYHLYLRENYRTVRFDNRRFPLPHLVEPGETVDMEIMLRAPIEANSYILMFDMVREGQAWFRDYGSRVAVIRLNVTKREWPEDNIPFSLEYGKHTAIFSGRQEIADALKIIRLTLSQNQVAFEGKTGRIQGFSAGIDYPQIWLRDANTIIPASRYYYDLPYLASWLEEHLAFQKDTGSLEDWVDSKGGSDKNTTETDQESSAVQAAFQIFNILGPDWLEKPIDGQKILTRLDRALSFVLSSRWDEKSGLITGAHTADWGDVDMVDRSQQAIYVDDRTHWTADIYDQSMFYKACLNLSAMMREAGDSERGAFWENKARSIGKNTDKRLWQEGKGFYRVHIHLDDLTHEFDEGDMFAMGGNTEAILSGLAGREKSRRIIEEAIKRQEEFRISTISGVLLPPYPKNFFKHPLCDDPYEYQNGGQWDWFGMRLVSAMFNEGSSRTAVQKLSEIIEKNVANRGFFEWDNKEGVGEGSDFFAGTAGCMGRALFEGYFGIELDWNSLSIAPKCGKDSAQVHIYQPANDIFVAYAYTYDEDEGQISLSYNSNSPDRGTIRILLPWTKETSEKKWTERDLDVRMDDRQTNFGIQTTNDDSYVVLRSDFQNRTVRVLRSRDR